ncbi:hypothetical protein [Parabacteroides leei]|uniref:hypothetical protein n=1 Tax=Parabacteroides leei TaxID=2939491 RepID=UPI001898BEDA|nr:hypothetical protein [Parabacteroides goldsteinii]
MKKIMFNDRFGLTKSVLDGRKTMTRRIAQPATDKQISLGHIDKDWYEDEDGGIYIPLYKVDEVIAIAQSYKVLGYDPDSLDRDPKDLGIKGFMKDSAGWNNKMFVRAAGCKHHIRVTNVKIQQLQDISDEDCLKEGVYRLDSANGSGGVVYSFVGASDKKNIGLYNTPREAFSALIDKVSGKGTWSANPFVWVYEFELVK